MTAATKFKACDGEDLLGLPTDANHVNVRWDGPGKVYFSWAQKGAAISAHLASDKIGRRHLKQAVNEFCEWCFESFEWCTMILGEIERPSMERLVSKCGFQKVIEHNGISAYMRTR